MSYPIHPNKWLFGSLSLGLWTILSAAGIRQVEAAPQPKASDDRRQDGDADGEEADADSPPDGVPERTRGAPHPDCDHRSPLFEHQVAAGEHLGAIAGRYGVRQADLLALNPGITDPNFIREGQTVRVCPTIVPRLRKEILHEVGPGDTAGAIALAHGLTVAELVAMQEGKLKDPNLLRLGQRLRLVVDGGVVPEFLPAPAKKVARAERGEAGRGRRPSKGTSPRVALQLPQRNSYFVKRPRLAYGTPKTIRGIQQAVERYQRLTRGGPKIHIGDISREGGGALKPHVSHQTGRDVDVGYVLRGADGHRTKFTGVTRSNLDVPRTWALLQAFIDTGDVEVIFMDYGLQELVYRWALEHGASERELDELFQYPRGRGRSHGIIRHWRSHQHHFHVRFRR